MSTKFGLKMIKSIALSLPEYLLLFNFTMRSRWKEQMPSVLDMLGLRHPWGCLVVSWLDKSNMRKAAELMGKAVCLINTLSVQSEACFHDGDCKLRCDFLKKTHFDLQRREKAIYIDFSTFGFLDGFLRQNALDIWEILKKKKKNPRNKIFLLILTTHK